LRSTFRTNTLRRRSALGVLSYGVSFGGLFLPFRLARPEGVVKSSCETRVARGELPARYRHCSKKLMYNQIKALDPSLRTLEPEYLATTMVRGPAIRIAQIIVRAVPNVQLHSPLPHNTSRDFCHSHLPMSYTNHRLHYKAIQSFNTCMIFILNLVPNN
jgi:hypothetical protein